MRNAVRCVSLAACNACPHSMWARTPRTVNRVVNTGPGSPPGTDDWASGSPEAPPNRVLSCIENKSETRTILDAVVIAISALFTGFVHSMPCSAVQGGFQGLPGLGHSIGKGGKQGEKRKRKPKPSDIGCMDIYRMHFHGRYVRSVLGWNGLGS